jgi:hypothetical protein
MIQERIEQINVFLAEAVEGEQQIAGLAKTMFDQQTSRQGLFLPDGKIRITPNNKMAWQSCHLLSGGRAANSQLWGTQRSYFFGLNMVLVGVCKSASGLTTALSALSEIDSILVEGFDNDTLSVLQRFWMLPANKDQNHDPSWWAFAIRYTIQDVSDDDLREYAHLIDNQAE